MNVGQTIPRSAAAVAVLLLSGCRQQRPPATVSIRGHTWTVEVADTQARRYDGLSERSHLPENAGMLFVFPRPEELQFCMRRCLIPLDIAFIDANLTVVKIHTMRVEPYGQERMTYGSGVPAQYALEVNAGQFARAGVQEGDAVVISESVSPPAKAESRP